MFGNSIAQLVHRASPLALAVAVSALPTVLHAQTSNRPNAASNETGEDIIVTAKGREQRLQDVPLAITTLDNSQLQARGIRDVRQLAEYTPSFNFYGGTGRADPTALAIRGLAPNTSDERYQGLSFFVDGVPLTGQVIGVDLTQVERVEVIKGPQSATFGRATYSGAVNYITQRPRKDEIAGFVRASLSDWSTGTSSKTSLGTYLAGRVDFPIVPGKLWVSVNGLLQDTGKRATDPGDGSDIARERTKAIGGVINFEPSSNFSMLARFAYSEERDAPALIHVMHPREWLAAGVPTVQLPRGPFALWPTVVPNTRNDVTGGAFLAGQSITEASRNRQRLMAALIAEYKFDGGLSLTYTGGYNTQDHQFNDDFLYRSVLPGADPVFGTLITATPAQVRVNASASAFQSANSEAFVNQSHQFVIASPNTGRFRWRVGGYYFKETDLNFDQTRLTATNPLGQARGRESIENIAGFAGAAFDLSDRITLELEGRYQSEQQVVAKCSFCRIVTPSDLVNTDKAFLPRVTTSFKLSPHNLLYALYAKGEKSARPTFDATDLNGDGSISDNEITLFVAKAETLDNFEIGSKNSFAGGRGILNVSAFYQKISNQQLITQEPTTRPNNTIAIISGVRNVGGSDILGFEGEFNFKVTPAFSVFASVGYAHQEFTSTTPITISSSSAVFFPDATGTGTLVLKGKSQANVPDWTGTVGAEYRTPIGSSGWRLTLRGDAIYRGKFYADLGNIATVPSSWKLNARIGLHSDAISIEAYVRNLLNDHTATGAFLGGGAFSCAFQELNTATYGTTAAQRCLFTGVPLPRQFGIEATFRF